MDTESHAVTEEAPRLLAVKFEWILPNLFEDFRAVAIMR